MTKLRAFVGHSFSDEDQDVVRVFLDHLDRIAALNPDFSWNHAKWAEAKELKTKVLRLMEDRNLFIGVCTAKEETLPIGTLTPCWTNTNKVKGSSSKLSRKTSDWVLQEIGLAVGRNMSIIILLENGVRTAGGLQGDLEHILFDRTAPEKSFDKLMEMIAKLLPSARAVSSDTAIESGSKDATAETEETDATLKEPQDDWNLSDFEFAIYESVILSDDDRFARINDAFTASKLTDQEHVVSSWDAWVEYVRLITGKGGKLDALEKIAAKNPETQRAQQFLARAYRMYDQDDRAATIFRELAESIDDQEKQLTSYGDAAVSFSNCGELESAAAILEKMREIAPNVEAGESTLIMTLRSIADDQEDIETYFHLTERLLQLHPDDHDVRFSLAYKYSNNDQNDLALFHYLKVRKNSRGRMLWNNLGVEFQHQKLPHNAILAYREAEQKDETLAMSNLAYGLLNAGFLDDARVICDKALSMPECHKNVSHALARINDIPGEEKEKQNKTLENVKPRSLYLQKFGQEFSKPTLQDGEGSWKDPNCTLHLVIKDGKIVATGNFSRPMNALAAAASMEKPSSEEIVVEYRGNVTGNTAKCQVTRKPTNPPKRVASLLSSAASTNTCLFAWDNDGKKISVCENPFDSNPTFYAIESIE